jgi:tetratricopeptide (TPR) repeat protein
LNFGYTDAITRMPEPHPKESLAGRAVAGYDVVEMLGAGGMGVVYRAVDRKLGRSVALKLLPETSKANAAARERFLREARVASALDHPNIGTIFGVEDLPEGGLCIVMAYYEGKTLAQSIAHRRLPLSDTIRIAVQTADGLAAAHEAGIIHLDVKPSNVMLTSSGLVKVVDFGLAKLVTAEEASLTKTAAVAGTVAYMSPEQARGQALDGRTDIWSLGVMLYECASGRLPFSGPDTYALLYSVVHEEPPALEGVYPDLAAAVRKSLDKEVAKRFASMREFADELRRIARELELSDAMETQVMGPESAGTGPTPYLPLAAIADKPRSLKRLAAAVVMGVLALAGAAMLNQGVRQRVVTGPKNAEVRQPTPAQNHTTMAILPFSGGVDTEMSALSGGLAQRLGARLTRLESFRDSLTVLPPGELLARSVSDGDEAIRKLGATMVVSGVLSRAGAGQQLTLAVRDRRRAQPETVTVENPSGDVGKLEDQAVYAVAQVLEIQADPQVSASLWRTGTSMAAAYEPYLRGVGYLQRWDKAENREQARAEFARAAVVDPQFALAQAGLAEAARIAYNANKNPADLQAALGYAQRAVQLDSTLADAHVVTGRIFQAMSEKRDLAVTEFQRALELEPRNSDAIQGMAKAYVELGRDADAEAAFKQAIRLRPWSWDGYNSLASYYFRKKRYADADAQYHKALEVAPDNASVYSNLGLTLLGEDKPAEAAKMYRRSIELEPDYRALNNLAVLDYSQRDFREAAEIYRRALELNDKDFIVWGSLGQALLYSGARRADAQASLRRAVALGEQQLQVHPDDVDTLALLALYQALLGDKNAALARVNEAMTRSSVTGAAAEYCAMAYEVTGDRANAVLWAQKALDTGYTWKELKGDMEMDQLVRSSTLRHSP